MVDKMSSSSSRFELSAGMSDSTFGMHGSSNRTTMLSHLLTSRCWREAARRATSHPHEVSSATMVQSIEQADSPPYVLKALLKANPRVTTDAFVHVMTKMKDSHRFRYYTGTETQQQQAKNLMLVMDKNKGQGGIEEEVIKTAKDIGDPKVFCTRVHVYVNTEEDGRTIRHLSRDPICPFLYAIEHFPRSPKVLAAAAPSPTLAFFIRNCWDTSIAGMELARMLGVRPGKHGPKNDDQVLELLRQHPSAAAYNGKNECPLNRAIGRRSSEEVVLTLLKSCPLSALVQKDNMFPVHLAIKNGYSIQVIAALARANPSALLAGISNDCSSQGNNCKLPFYRYLWEQHCKPPNKQLSSLPSNLKNPKYRKFWEVIACSLVISHYGTIPEDFYQKPFAEILHASIEATRHGDGNDDDDGPSRMFKQVWVLFKRYWGKQTDRNGDLPLVAMLRKPFISKEEVLALQYIIAGDDERDGSTAASQVNNDGRTPLLVAILSHRGWDEGVGCIYEAAKHMAAKRDPKTGLYPFMVAATPSCADEGDLVKQVDVTYRLLRAHPGCLDQCIQGGAVSNGEPLSRGPTEMSKKSVIEKRLEALEKEKLELERELASLKENSRRSNENNTPLPAAKRQRRD